MSGFVYKVRVAGKTLIKKEIPGPDTVDEFLYEVNALNSLRFSQNVIEFYGVVVDNEDESVKGLLINYAEKGALIDVIYDSQEEDRPLPWPLREKWARQIVQGVSDVHEAGFVQGDLTLSNIVIDYEDNAKIIDINRRGCPVGWEPPEATALIDTNQRISMYIGVKSDLYQLGMVLWALATLEDEPEAHGRPLRLASEIEVPTWYRTMVEYCLHEDPRVRLQATELLTLFPEPASHDDDFSGQDLPSISVDDGVSLREYIVRGTQPNGHSQVRPVLPHNGWSYAQFGNTHATFSHTHATSPGYSDDPYHYPSRGRSPARSLPSNHDVYSPPYMDRRNMWSNRTIEPSASHVDLGEEGERLDTPRENHAPGEIAAKLQRDLDQLEAEETQKTGGESQPNGATLATGASREPEVADEAVKDALPLADNGTEAVTPVYRPTTKATFDRERNLEDSQHETRDEIPRQSEIIGTSGTSETRGVGTDILGTPIQIDDAVQPPEEVDGESESLNYTHDRREDVPARSTEASPSRAARSPPKNVPAELTGIGSAYDKQHEEIRKLTFSEEDLGLAPTATNKCDISSLRI